MVDIDQKSSASALSAILFGNAAMSYITVGKNSDGVVSSLQRESKLLITDFKRTRETEMNFPEFRQFLELERGFMKYAFMLYLYSQSILGRAVNWVNLLRDKGGCL